jgi:hypothetical protein
MRALLIAALLSLATAPSALAQPNGDAVTGAQREQMQNQQAPPTPAEVGSYQNICIGTALVTDPTSNTPYNYFLFSQGDATMQIDVTPQGLRVHSTTQVAPLPSSPSADTRYNTMIETLRAAAASRSRLTVNAREGIVHTIVVYWAQRCD